VGFLPPTDSTLNLMVPQRRVLEGKSQSGVSQRSVSKKTVMTQDEPTNIKAKRERCCDASALPVCGKDWQFCLSN